jgi:hypothetical protein
VTIDPPRPPTPPSSRSPAAAAERLAALKKTASREYRQQEKTKRQEERRATRSARRTRPWYLSVLWWGGLLVLPFVVLVRVSVWAYSAWSFPTWGALALGVSLTLCLVGIYGARLSARLTGKARVRLVFTRFALPVTLAYGGYALLYLSSANAKTEEVRSYYTSLHPLFRLALSTAVLFDRDLVVTDLRRVPADYVAMGLPVYEASLHFRQADGYVHAADLRTIGRPAWRIALLTGYFRSMGFRTLRHVGTADHLHVSLPTRE